MRVIRASEIGEYVFCHRAWWLHHVAGYKSANVNEMAAGTARHARHGLTVAAAGGLRLLALLLLAAAVIWLALSLLPTA